MSDRPGDLEFKLQHIVIAVKDVGEWYDLGLQLGLPDSILAAIASHPDIKGRQRLMLSEWLKYDTEASWDKLASALNIIGENVVAANVRSRFMKATVATPVIDTSNQDDKTCQEMNQTILQKIKGQFASLQVEVRSAMEARQVKLKDVHQFLVSFFQSDCCIPEASDLTKLFNVITEAKLWRYDHYGPLKVLAEKFLPDDNPARKLVNEYKNQLSGFYTTTKIIEFIDLSELDDSEDDNSEEGAQQSLSPKEYKKLFRELKVMLKLDRKVKLSDMTMSYIDKLWKALIEEFNLPPLTAIIKKIVCGSLIITWLVPPQVSIVSWSKALRFYQQHNIVQVQLDGSILYHSDEDLIDADGNTALIKACRLGHVETARALLDYGTSINYQNKAGESALWCASFADETECVKILLKHGAHVDLPDGVGNTALIKACGGGYVETARVLLEHGATIDYQNNEGVTSLSEACFAGESETVSLLLKTGAKTNFQDKYGGTALFWAALKDCSNIVQMLVDCGAAVDLGRNNMSGRTGLIQASDIGYIDTVMILLEAKADPNITDENGETALHLAALGGHVEIVKLLVQYGVAVDIRNKEGLTALDVARGFGKQSVCEVLEQYTKQTRTELTEEQRKSVYQRLLKMLERTFLREQVKKREEGQKEEKVGGKKEKRSLWNRPRGRRNRPEQITGTAPASKK